MSQNAQRRLRKHDVLVASDAPSVQWQIADQWRDVYVLEQVDHPWRRRFVYEAEISDASRFMRAARATSGDERKG